MKTKFGFIDPGAIVGVVVALLILAIGVFIFMTVIQQVKSQTNFGDGGGTAGAINNTTTTGSSVFNIVGVVMIIGAIMAIVGLVYNYVR